MHQRDKEKVGIGQLAKGLEKKKKKKKKNQLPTKNKREKGQEKKPRTETSVKMWPLYICAKG